MPSLPIPPRARRRVASAARLAVALLAAGAAACGGSASIAVADSVRAPSAPLPPLEPASILLPITIQTSALVAQLDRAVPKTDSLGRDACLALGGAVCHQYVYRRDTLAVTATGDRIDLLARVRYRGRVAVPGGVGLGSCGYAPEPMKRAELRMATSLYWRTDWRLGSRNTQLGTVLPDPCEVTFAKVNATPLMQRIADWQLGKLAAQVDSALPATADLRRAADSLWRELQQPLAVDSAGTAWLVMNPERISLFPLEGTGGSIRTGLSLVARPRIVSGAKPSIAVRPLPALTLARAGTGLRVPVQVELPFAELSRQATELLRQQTATEALKVTNVTIYGAGDTAVVKLDMSGRMNGSLTLVGRPRFDEPTRTLVMEGLDWTVDSRDALSRLKATLAAPFIGRAIGQATNGGKYDVGTQLDLARAELTKQMNRPLAPDVAVGGGVSALKVTGLYTTADAFVVRVLLEGSAGLWAR